MTGTRDPDELSADDARILGVESPVIMGHTLKLNVLASNNAPLDMDALRDAVAERLPSQPRATERVDTTGAQPRWVKAFDFDIRDHVRRHPTPACVDKTDMWRAVSGLMAEHLDRAKPLWTFDVIGPLEDGSEAIAVRIHHAMCDGIAGVRFLREVLWDEQAVAPPSARGRSANSKVDTRSALLRMPGAIAREFGHRATRVPFDLPITARRELAFAVASLTEMKAIGASRPARATVNDVLLAVVAGGLREWLGVTGSSRRHLRGQVPVSLHHREETATDLGNHDSFMNIDLPLGLPDPLERLDRIRAETTLRKRLDDADEIYELFHALGRMKHIGGTVQRLAGNPREFSVSISNVPGPSTPVSVGGRQVLHLFSSSEPAMHHALRISAISCGSDIGVGLCTDPHALPDVARLGRLIELSYDELRTAAGC